MYVDIPWPPIVNKFTALFYTLSFNVEIVHPECTVSFNYFDKLKMVIAAPLVLGFMMSVLSKYWSHKRSVYEAKKDVEKSRKYRKRWKLLRQVMVIFLTSVYSPVCYYSLRMFEACVETPLGDLVMASDTRLSCTDAQYTLHTLIACVALAFFGIGIPILVICVVAYLRSKHTLNSGDSLLRYGALYEWYNGEFNRPQKSSSQQLLTHLSPPPLSLPPPPPPSCRRLRLV